MVPFVFEGNYEVLSIVSEGEYRIHDEIARLRSEEGEEKVVTMVQRWPVKVPITCYQEKPRPFKLLETGVRTMDTLNPIVEGERDLSLVPLVQGKQFCSTPFLSRQKPTL